MSELSGNAANPAKKKPRGKPFVSGDPRSNVNGQRNATAVAFNRTLREIIAGVGNEELSKDGRSYSRIELAVRGLYQKAAKGDVSAFSALVERVEGKIKQDVDLTSSDGSMTPKAVMFVPYPNDANVSADSNDS